MTVQKIKVGPGINSKGVFAFISKNKINYLILGDVTKLGKGLQLDIAYGCLFRTRSH